MMKPRSRRITASRNCLAILACLGLWLASGCSKNSSDPGNNENPPVTETPVIKPIVISALPHDSSAFTQGLVYRDSVFYESTGLYGRSQIRRVDPASGAVLQQQSLAAGFFGEGLALKDNRLVQLTWQENRAFVYSVDQLAKIDSFSYPTQGWGLTHDEAQFIMSDGSATLFFRDDQFALIGEVEVTLDGEPITQLNELEYVAGLVYANVWRTDFILEIDPVDGVVQRVIDCSDIVAAEEPVNSSAVLNGIAYDPARQIFFLTGKLWKHIYEVQIAPLH